MGVVDIRGFWRIREGFFQIAGRDKRNEVDRLAELRNLGQIARLIKNAPTHW